jgi:hypothetical protein
MTMIEHDESFVAERDDKTQERGRAPWSPAQAICAIAGLVLTVIGGVALARTGWHVSDVPATRTQVAGLHFTSMSALIQLAVGVFVLLSCVQPMAAKSAMVLTGLALLAFGLVVAISPVQFYNLWGYVRSTGTFYAVVGAILLLGASLSPIFTSRSSVTRTRRGVQTRR